MSSQMTEKRARSLAYKMLATRARTCRQITQALVRKGAEQKLAEDVIRELQETGYLDDRRFSLDYIAARLDEKPCGPLYLLAKLAAAGVNGELSRQVLEEAYPEARRMEEAKRLVRRLLGRGETCPQKVMRKLVNRGFSAITARRAAEEEFQAYLDITQ